MDTQQLQKEVDAVFNDVFGRTPFKLRMEDIAKEARELERFTDLRNLREEAGDLLASLLQLCNESGWSIEDTIHATLDKIKRRRQQYLSLGRKVSIVILGGSHNPTTLGHIAALQFVLNVSHQFDEGWLMPCYEHMHNKELAPAKHRLKMADLASQIDGRIRVCPYEIDNKLRGDTYHCLHRMLSDESLTEKYQFSWLMGLDVANDCPNWPNFEDLINTIPIVVVPRPGIQPNLKNPWFFKAPHIFISPEGHNLPDTHSSACQKLLQDGQLEAAGQQLDSKVLNYILENRLWGASRT